MTKISQFKDYIVNKLRKRAAGSSKDKAGANATENSEAKCEQKPKVGAKTVLFCPLESVGHLNSLVRIADKLKSEGHRTVFLFAEPITSELKSRGHEVYDCDTSDLTESSGLNQAQDKWNEVIQACGPAWRSGDVLFNLETELKLGFGTMIKDIQRLNPIYEAKLALIKPDMIVIDHYFGTPALFKLNVPWVRIHSASPLCLHDQPELPPAWLGLPTKFDRNQEDNKRFVEKHHELRMKLYEEFNGYWRSQGMPEDLPKNPIAYIPTSPHLNIYMFPEELDYSEYELKQWTRCDCMVRDIEAKKFELPEKLKDKPGKLIFLSLGSLASADVILMKRMVEMLADCPHKFIVSKGPLHDQYELADNMWGNKFLPQLEVLNTVDLIITHGGNNTVTESFYYGVPGLIVCPLFADQFDNATRLQELGFGVRLDPYNCTKEQLHEAIETMLNKQDVRGRVEAISKRMRLPENQNKAINLISEFVAKH